MPRPHKRRIVERLPVIDYFKPAGIPLAGLDEVILRVDELEAIRLKDYEGLDHAASAEKMQVSRPTFHRILSSGHRKVAEALTKGKAIRIEGGAFRITDRHYCRDCGHVWHGTEDGIAKVCPRCGTEEIVPPAPPRGRRHRQRGPRRGR